jgi:Pyruvate/2-oxoacid:ferredoxin oxidoreductase delta subunit
MAVRPIIEIDEELCDGCGDCVSACAEGAIQLVDGKARLVKDVYCDGLGACIGDCHAGAITIVEREAESFDEAAVAQHLVTIGRGPEPRTPGARLNVVEPGFAGGAGCPGSRAQTLQPPPVVAEGELPTTTSQLRHWPIQLHLVPPTAPFFQNADVLIAADCVPFAVADFHSRFLADTSLAIACPKLDHNQEIYREKLTAMIDAARIRSVHVVVMEVPCCGGLVRLVQDANTSASRSLPIRCTVIGVDGQTRREFMLDGVAV